MMSPTRAVPGHVSTYRRKLLSRAVSEFHHQSEILALTGLNEDQALFRVSHQPNFLAALNVTGAALLLSGLEENACTVYTFVDYSTIQDPRMRAAYIPIGVDKIGILHSSIGRSKRSKVAYSMAPPTHDQVNSWINTLRYSVKLTERDLRRLSADTRHPAEAQRLLDEIHDLWLGFLARSSSVTDFNSFVTIDLLRRITPKIVGVSGQRAFTIAGAAMGDVINQLTTRGVIDEGDWWLVCARCNRRIPCYWRQQDGKVSAECSKCDKRYQHIVPFGTSQNDERGRIIPRVQADVLLEYAWLPGAAHGSYAGSLEHITNTRLIAANAGLQLPPELVWDPVNLIATKPNSTPLGPGAELLSRGQAPLLCYYLIFHQSLAESLMKGPIATINTPKDLKGLCSLPSETSLARPNSDFVRHD
jgi:hypothetical protein